MKKMPKKIKSCLSCPFLTQESSGFYCIRIEGHVIVSSEFPIDDDCTLEDEE